MKPLAGEPKTDSPPTDVTARRPDYWRTGVWTAIAAAAIGTAVLALGPIASERFSQWRDDVGYASEREASDRAQAAVEAMTAPAGLELSKCTDPFMSTWCAATELDPSGAISSAISALAGVMLLATDERCTDERGMTRCEASISMDGRDAGSVMAFRSTIAWEGWEEPTAVTVNLFRFDQPAKPAPGRAIDRDTLIDEITSLLPSSTTCFGADACQSRLPVAGTVIDVGATVPSTSASATLAAIGSTLYTSGLRTSPYSRDDLLIMDAWATSGVTTVMVQTVDTEAGIGIGLAIS